MLFLPVFAAAAVVFAQTLAPAPPPPPMPSQAEAPDVVPPPVSDDLELEPQVTITKKDGETVEEARVNGKLKWVKVTPRHGRPYYLLPDHIEGTLIRREGFDRLHAAMRAFGTLKRDIAYETCVDTSLAEQARA